MATYTRRTVTRTDHEWIVPTPGPWGAAWQDIESAVTAAWTAYCQHHGRDINEATPGDFARFTVADDQIVISFTTEEPDRA